MATNFQSKKRVYQQLCQILLSKQRKSIIQKLLEECKNEQENIKMPSLIDDDLEKSSSDESDSESDNDHDECNK